MRLFRKSLLLAAFCISGSALAAPTYECKDINSEDLITIDAVDVDDALWEVTFTLSGQTSTSSYEGRWNTTHLNNKELRLRRVDNSNDVPRLELRDSRPNDILTLSLYEEQNFLCEEL